jgi:RNA polymerase sigma-70 factor (ECF subfamily)
MAVGVEEASELSELQSRGEEAVAEFFGRHRGKLLRMIALRLDARILAKVDCEDVLQDAFVESARRIQDYLDRPSVPFFVWLRQITHQVLIDTHRRYLGARMRDVRQEASLHRAERAGASSACLVAQLADSLTTPSQCVVREETVGELKRALAKLAEIDREVLLLRHMEELSNTEVAQILAIDKYAASKRYLRALKRLRNVM